MIYSVRKINQWLLIFIVTLVVSGCIGRKAPEVTYFSLLTMDQLGEVQEITSLPDVNLGVGPVTIPDSLKRSQIATRQHGNQYSFDEFNRWAGVLERDATAVLGDNLGLLLDIKKVGFFPWLNHFKPEYRVAVIIIRLDGDLNSEAVLSARWAISDADGKNLLAAGKSDYRQPLEEASYAALIKAESMALADLSKEVAIELKALASQK
jgi:uncharacterized lipoprotein YmbA